MNSEENSQCEIRKQNIAASFQRSVGDRVYGSVDDQRVQNSPKKVILWEKQRALRLCNSAKAYQ